MAPTVDSILPATGMEDKNMKNETSWLDNICKCDSCGDAYKIGYLIPTVDGESICEDCLDVIEAAEADEKK